MQGHHSLILYYNSLTYPTNKLQQQTTYPQGPLIVVRLVFV